MRRRNNPKKTAASAAVFFIYSPVAWFARLAGIVNAEQIIAGTQTPDQLGVTAVDEHTLRVQLNKPVPYFINLVSHFSLFPVHQKTVEQFGNDWTKPGNLVGNCAFALKERVVNEKLVLTPNPYYRDRANTRLTKVTFVPINQESNATKRYLAGDIDITESFPKQTYQKLLKDVPGQGIHAGAVGNLLLRLQHPAYPDQ